MRIQCFFSITGTCTSDNYVCHTIHGIKECFIDNSTCGDTRRSYEAYNLVIGLIVGTIVIICAVATIWFIFLCFSASKDDTDEVCDLIWDRSEKT